MEIIKTAPIACSHHNMNKQGSLKSLQIHWGNDFINTVMEVNYLDPNGVPIEGGKSITDQFKTSAPPQFIIEMFPLAAVEAIKDYMTSKMQ